VSVPVVRKLSWYVLWQWFRIFVLAAVGLPVVSVLVYITDKLARLIDRGLSPTAIALSGLYGLPWNMANMIPAAALFATVFTIGPLSRNSEITAAKAGGISFYRLMGPLVFASVFAAVLTFFVSEIATEATARQAELEKERVARNQTARFQFVYRADEGWIYTVSSLDTQKQAMGRLLLEHAGRKKGYANLAVTADSARWVDSTGHWRLISGSSHIYTDSGVPPFTLRFAAATVKTFNESPRSLLLEPKRPEEMAYRELGDYIQTLKRSGNDTKKLEVDQAIKLALPAACLVIALFGAPLAVSNPRAGTAWGIAISLGTTVLYLLMINLSKAIGNSGIITPPALAAWVPNVFFLVVGLMLLRRVRT
jgi:lipopolysaccharide export system permease protein